MGNAIGITAARAAAIEALSVIDASIVGDNLILERFNESTIDAGIVKGIQGLQGEQGLPGVDGLSVPSGGLAGYVLRKLSDDDYDYDWSSTLGAYLLSLKTGNYTLALDDAEDIVMVDNEDEPGSAFSQITVPLNATVPFIVGTSIRVAQINIGGVEIIPTPGVTLRYPAPQINTLVGRGAVVELIKIASDEWILNGHGNLALAGKYEEYVPTISASTNPNYGASASRTGWYVQDSLGRVHGGASIRFGGSGAARGSGRYRFSLPVPGAYYDSNAQDPIGVGLFGTSSVHSVGMLQFDTVVPSSGHANLTFDGGLWVTHSLPSGGSTPNIHYNFNYLAGE